MTDTSIDIRTDPVLLGALSDRLLAERVLEHARREATRMGTDAAGASPRSTLLNQVVPALAAGLGANVSLLERMAASPVSEATADAVVKQSADAVMAVVRSSGPGERDPLSADPMEGNLAAMLVDRYAARHGVARTSDADGWTKPRQTGLTTVTGLAPSVTGPEAVGLDALATEMLAATAGRGHHAVPYWSPGHASATTRKGSLASVMTPESILRLDAEDAIAARLHALPADARAGEILEHARDMRERHGLGGGAGRHSFVIDHAVPAMAAMHGLRLRPGEGEHFRDNPPANDQEAVATLSSRIMLGIVDGKSHLIDLPMRRGGSPEIALSDRVLMRDAAAGNSAAMMLDGVARMLGAERGGRSDPLGQSVEKATRSAAWEPQANRTPPALTRAAMNQRAMAMARATSMVRG